MPPMGGGAPGGGPPGGVGGASAPSPMAGHQQGAMQKLNVALKSLQSSLDGIPIGSELHNEIITAIQKIGKHLPQGGQGGDPNAMIQELAGLAKGARQNPNMAALQGMMPPGGGAGGGAPPSPMGAGA